jgi:hypothetical protein
MIIIATIRNFEVISGKFDLVVYVIKQYILYKRILLLLLLLLPLPPPPLPLLLLQ